MLSSAFGLPQGATGSEWRRIVGGNGRRGRVGRRVSALRWSGGTLAQTRTEVCGFDIPGLFGSTRLCTCTPDRVRRDLTDRLAPCMVPDPAFPTILPTVRYARDIARIEADLAT